MRARTLISLLPLVATSLWGCDGEADLCEGVDGPCASFQAGTSTAADIERAFVGAEPGQTFIFGAGTFELDRQLGLDVADTVIRGQGMDETILDFSTQTSGHGIFVESPGDNFLIEDLSIRDSRQNGVEVRGTRGIVFRRIRVEWTADPNEFDPTELTGDPGEASGRSPFGRYGVYPTACDHVLVERIEVRRASDAGVYVGSCNDAVLRYNLAEENVSGFQVENTLRADVYGNVGRNNVLGLLVHDLPGQPINANGDQTRVFDNEFRSNNFVNFALPGDLTQAIPSGSGMIVLARGNVEIRDNTFADNDTVNLAFVSYYILGGAFTPGGGYDPFPSDIHAHDNTFIGGGMGPETSRRGVPIAIGLFLELLRQQPGYDDQVPDIVYDGFFNPEVAGADPGNLNPMGICLGENGSFLNLNVNPANLEGPNIDGLLEDANNEDGPFRCTGMAALPAVDLELWAGAGYDPTEAR